MASTQADARSGRTVARADPIAQLRYAGGNGRHATEDALHGVAAVGPRAGKASPPRIGIPPEGHFPS